VSSASNDVLYTTDDVLYTTHDVLYTTVEVLYTLHVHTLSTYYVHKKAKLDQKFQIIPPLPFNLSQRYKLPEDGRE
jgi:hypothetical protein